MGRYRRQFFTEFKFAAVRWLEVGVSIAEVAQGLEVNPSVLHWLVLHNQQPSVNRLLH